ncbi:methyltransferase [Govanella unica]|uniref:Acetylserotonin O-methyltransferase n=1 Tax=Govanella unica TaxID=2975056 RepID=A0A9X3TY43_9PROT|nr:methyltransferase [Govania unica]MDA5193812.1 acetylserotonin O-methyltransferase [Govania unica]
MTDLNPARITEIGMGFMASKTLLSAVELGLFTTLSDRRMTGPEIGQELGLHSRAIPDFPDALLALGFLERDGDGPNARYGNTPETAAFLDKTKPGYIGGILDMCNHRNYGFWGDLSEGLKTGQSQNEVKHNGKPLFESLYAEPARLEEFMQAMAGISRLPARAFAEKFDFSPYKTLADIGGATGVLSLAIAARHPHIRATSCDLPAVLPIAKRTIDKAGLSDRVTPTALDFFTDSFPKVDVITMGMILHDWNLDRKKMLIAKAYDALPKGGAFIVIEQLIDDARRHHVPGLLMSLNMLIECADGFDYTGADFRDWCLDAGFARVEILPLAGPMSAGIAYK